MDGTDRSARRTVPWLAAAVAVAVTAQPLPQMQESVDVRVVNVDVVVTDFEGRPVRGLRREDFRLWVNGRPAEVDYFTAVVGGRAADPVADGAAEAAVLPYLAIVHDGRSLRSTAARDLFERLEEQLDGLLERTRAVMVVRQGESLVVEQPLSRNRELLAAALDRVEARSGPALDRSHRGPLLSELERTEPPRIARQTEDDLMAERARQLLRQIRTQAELERFQLDTATRQLRLILRSLSGLPGRKAILFLGEGLRLRPADPLFRLWWSKFSRYARQLGVPNIEAEMSLVRSDQRLAQLVEEANANRVSFYSFDPGGLRTAGTSAEYQTLEANQYLAAETERQLDSLADLSLATGGVGRVRSARFDLLLAEMLEGFASYYSLGFEPRGEERGTVRVRLREPGLRLRYLSRFRARSEAQKLEEATLATLLTAAEDNRLEIGVEMGEPEAQADGTFLVPVLVKVPVARLVLLPQRAHHVGRLSFVVLARDADGSLSPPARGEVPIEIANADLLSAMGRTTGYRLQMRVAAGEQTVAIGVRDEVGREDATVRLVMAPGRDV